MRTWGERSARWTLLVGCLAVALSLLAGCGLRPGGDALAYLRDGQLWTVQPDGANAHRIAEGKIVSFAWSPDHHQLVYRTLASGGTDDGSDAPGDLFVTSINGGAPLQIAPSKGFAARSDAWWNPEGNRMLYRERYVEGGVTGPPTYIVSQADQPLGIASKEVRDAAGLPVLAADGSRVAVVDQDGNLRLGQPGATGDVAARGVLLTLPVTNRPARVLWQPRRQALFYMTADKQGVALMLREIGGAARTLLTLPALVDVAFSPDGTRLLVRTPQEFQLRDVAKPDPPVYSWPEADPTAVAYWSPKGHFVLAENASGMQLVNLGAQSVSPLLAYATITNPHPIAVHTLWRPATGSRWSPDGARIVFAAGAGDKWLDAELSAGVYVATIGRDGAPGAAKALARGDVHAPSWTYADPSTTFLVPS